MLRLRSLRWRAVSDWRLGPTRPKSSMPYLYQTTSLQRLATCIATPSPPGQTRGPVCAYADSCLEPRTEPLPSALIAMDPAFTYGLVKGTAGAPHLDPGPAALDMEFGVYGKLKVTQLTAPLYEYVLDHTDEPQVPIEQGRYLSLLVKLTRAEKCIEIGVFTGYSSLSIALALPPTGRLMACDPEAHTLEMAKRFAGKAGVAHKVEYRCVGGIEMLTSLLDDRGAGSKETSDVLQGSNYCGGDEGSYDLAFVDADKENQLRYYELILQLLRPGGVVLIDNVFWRGRVSDPTVTDSQTKRVREFNDLVHKDSRVTSVMV